jgi:hypothetical protein
MITLQTLSLAPPFSILAGHARWPTDVAPIARMIACTCTAPIPLTHVCVHHAIAPVYASHATLFLTRILVSTLCQSQGRGNAMSQPTHRRGSRVEFSRPAANREVGLGSKRGRRVTEGCACTTRRSCKAWRGVTGYGGIGSCGREAAEVER